MAESGRTTSTRMTICSSGPAKPKRSVPPGVAEPVTMVVRQRRRPSRVAMAPNTRSRAPWMVSFRA